MKDENIPFGEEHTWRPSSLIARASEPPEPPTIGGLLYPAKRTLLSGETESLKTWFALIVAKAEMDAGYPVAWADVDAMGPAALLERFRALGVADEVVDKLFLFYEPAERLVDDRLREVCAEIADRGVRLFVIDAFNPMLGLHGLDPGSTSDVETFWREVAAPITVAGAAPALLDHVTKNADTRGKYAYGSERKASGAIVHIGFRLLSPFARGETGSALLSTHKDRPGFLPRPTIGKLVLVSDGERVTYSLDDDVSHVGDAFRPTVLMDRVSRELEAQSEPRTLRWIQENVKGKQTGIKTAVDVLADEGYLDKTETPRGHYFTSAKPYRTDEDPVLEEALQTATPPRPRGGSRLCSVPLRDRDPATPPIGVAVALAVDRDPGPRPRPLPAVGEDGYLNHLFDAFEKGIVTEAEWRQGEAAHRLVTRESSA